jgi:hypothetical protein
VAWNTCMIDLLSVPDAEISSHITLSQEQGTFSGQTNALPR